MRVLHVGYELAPHMYVPGVAILCRLFSVVRGRPLHTEYTVYMCKKANKCTVTTKGCNGVSCRIAVLYFVFPKAEGFVFFSSQVFDCIPI